MSDSRVSGLIEQKSAQPKWVRRTRSSGTLSARLKSNHSGTNAALSSQFGEVFTVSSLNLKIKSFWAHGVRQVWTSLCAATSTLSRIACTVTSWQELPGTGTLETYSIMHFASVVNDDIKRLQTPLILAYVLMDGSSTLFPHLLQNGYTDRSSWDASSSRIYRSIRPTSDSFDALRRIGGVMAASPNKETHQST